MLQMNSPHALAAENNEFRIRQRLGIERNVVQLIMERKLVCEECGVKNDGWAKQESKTEQRMDGRQQRMVSGSLTQHHGAGLIGG